MTYLNFISCIDYQDTHPELYLLLYNTWAKVVPVESLSEGGKPDLVLDTEPPSRTIRGSYRPPTSTLDETSGSFHSTVKSLGLLQASSADSDPVRGHDANNSQF